jgi:hypothetical protein
VYRAQSCTCVWRDCLPSAACSAGALALGPSGEENSSMCFGGEPTAAQCSASYTYCVPTELPGVVVPYTVAWSAVVWVSVIGGA